MDRVFGPRNFFTVPDGTQVSAFLNATDTSQDDVPWDALGHLSIAAGRVTPNTHSWVHIHPAVTQVTYLTSGRLVVRMKDGPDTEPYDLAMEPGNAVVSRPGTLFQLRNANDEVAEVLYIVSPSYVFEMEGEHVTHDDAVMVSETWADLVSAGYDVPALKITPYEALAARAEAKRRLAKMKDSGPQPLSEDDVCSLKDDYDYLAPDGSEIRLLVSGERGGLAHCVLPAGKVSAPVRHRTVEEFWYVLSGAGEIWRTRDHSPRIDRIREGDSVRIPVGSTFQFRAAENGDLKLLLATTPPWPGPQEAVPATGEWEPLG